MKEQHPHLQIEAHMVDGSARTFLQDDHGLANRTLSNLHPVLIFRQERLTIADEDMDVSMVPSLVTRIDLITDQWSVWDFPFVLGALVELTEAEFTQGVQSLPEREQPNVSREKPVFLDIEMVNGQRTFLWMQVVAGLSSARLAKIYSLIKERYLIFGLRSRGIGILNLSNLLSFSVHPEPPKTICVEPTNGDIEPEKCQIRSRPTNGTQHIDLHGDAVALDLKEHQQTGSTIRLRKRL